METCASSQDGWTGTTLTLLSETTKGGRQSTPDSSHETPDTRKDSGPWEVGNKTSLGLPNPSLERASQLPHQEGKPRQGPAGPWSPDMAPRAQEAPGPGEEGAPQTEPWSPAPARPAACESVLLQRGNGHRTVQNGRHPEPHVVSVPTH